MNRRIRKASRRYAARNPDRIPGTVHQILRKRRETNRSTAILSRHRRAVARGEDEGVRCWDCRNVPLRPWEPVLPRDKFGMTL